MRSRVFWLILVLVLVAPSPRARPELRAEGPPTAAETAPQTPSANPSRNAYFGDFHVHTNWSLDAFIMGGNLDDPTVAYRFGRGDAIVTSDGREVRLRVPLDFMAVTDHDSTLGKCTSARTPATRPMTRRRVATFGTSRSLCAANRAASGGKRSCGTTVRTTAEDGDRPRSVGRAASVRRTGATSAPDICGTKSRSRPMTSMSRGDSPPSRATSGRRVLPGTACTIGT